MVEGDSTDARLARAGAHLSRGDLLSAVREVEQLDEASRLPAADWLILAKERIAAEHAAELVRAHVRCTAEAFVDAYA